MNTLLAPTPGQTIGPFFAYALPFERDNELVPPGSPGSIRLHGVVTDGAGAPVPDALLEIWQADASGAVPSATGSLHRDGWTFTGWGRASTDDEGHYSFTTVEPGAVQADSAPFIAVTVFARGLLNRLFTRAYVPDDRLGGDLLLNSLPAQRRQTLIAVRDEHGLRFDVRLQGDDETVFLRYPGHRREPICSGLGTSAPAT
jgi:protocatechuate 3,4-dioxygenase, alpha subunit